MARVIVVALVVLAGCADAGSGSPPAAAGLSASQERMADVYEAAIRRLTGRDSTFGPDHEFGVLFILDRARPDAASPDEEKGGGAPIPPAVQEELVERLADVAPVEFVPDGDEVIGPPRKGSVVRDGGALLTLGTIPEGEDRVEVGVSLYVANLAGTWLTYVVEQGDDGWKVTGTTGPVAVS